MLDLVILVAIIIAVTVVPVMLAARVVHAKRTGFGPALLAIFLQMVASAIIRHLFISPLVTLAVAIVVGSGIYAIVLKTTWLRGFAVGVLATIMAVIVIVVLMLSFAALLPAGHGTPEPAPIMVSTATLRAAII